MPGRQPASPEPRHLEQTQKPRFVILDSLRGVAAIGVLLYHTELVFGLYGAFHRSYLFVDLFFLISGFVLALSLEGKHREPVSSRTFLWARLRRLWPTIAIGILVGLVLNGSTMAPGDRLIAVVLGLLIIPWLTAPHEIFPLNSPEWSLFFEIVANVLHALVLRRLGERGLLAVIAVSGVALIAVTVWLGSNSLGGLVFNWWLGLPRLLFSYSMGVWMARRWRAAEAGPGMSWQLAIALPPIALAILSGTLLTIAIGDLLFVMVLMPLFFWRVLGVEIPRHAAAPLLWLGDLSFPLYAVHMPIIWFIARESTERSWLFIAASVALCVASAEAVRRAQQLARRRRLARNTLVHGKACPID